MADRIQYDFQAISYYIEERVVQVHQVRLQSYLVLIYRVPNIFQEHWKDRGQMLVIWLLRMT